MVGDVEHLALCLDQHLALVEIDALSNDDVKRRVSGFAALPYDIPRGSIAAYYPEANPLLALAHHDAKSGTPAAKSIPVTVRAMTAEAQGRS